ncbi:hypoxia-inducible factor 1-alpha [Stomoxys calcitrans]|uniref:hypoxia-inducible factor 1-alpha n=1 Tax=Stomoxys calcitrans TaxID=35570 RepID=UPI0027E3A3A1|nr:hypoxia-inducible factor 1-alpha [Stomoxys calcitrans]XP_059224268.1 hypoxia-inducible factor 1-alpha [Stomoxys calcitrans]
MGPENIPQLSEANLLSMDIGGDAHKTSAMDITNTRNDVDTHRTQSISSWSPDNDTGTDVGDDNMSQVGSDYSEVQNNDLYNHAMPTDDGFADDVKYHPSEMMLRPTSSSTIQFNYNFPPLSTLAMRPSQRPHHHLPPHVPEDQHYAHTHPLQHQQQEQHQQHQGHLFRDPRDMCASPTVECMPHAHPSQQSYFHSNMWYPNAPIGSYRSYGSHSCGRQFVPQYSHDHMLDMFQLSNSGREARNRAEKNRRDKLNGSIQELSTMVAHVAESPRRVDKTAVLRFAAHGLRLKYVFGKSLNNQSFQTTDTLMKLLDSFFLTLTCNGQIVLVSSSIEQHLGHCQADLYGQNILHITHPEDHQMLKQKLIPTDVDSLFDIQPEDENGEPRQRTQAEEEEIDRRLREDRRSFTVRLARSGPRSETTSYELVKIDGSFRRSDMAPRGLKTGTLPSTLQLMRRSRGREDILPLHTISGNDIVLIAIARIVRPPVINTVLEANRLEYKTRHLIDGRIIDCDQRISLVAGYMTDEVRNLSPFTFMHQDDVRWVIVALRQMYDCNSSYGESTYRLFTRNGKIIYLHTKGFLEIDKTTNKVHSFICVNTLLSEEEGRRRVQHMKTKFSVIIDTKIPQSLADVPASENPLQLEKAVLCLIQNLHQSASEDETDSNMSTSMTSAASSSKSQKHHHMYHHQSPHSPYATTAQGSRLAKTPPLALVPPAAESIKNSISKSVCVVKTTAGKFLQVHNSEMSYRPANGNDSGGESSTNGERSRYSSNVDSDTELQGFLPYDTTRIAPTSGMKRKINYSTSETEEDDEYKVPAQRRRATEKVSESSIEQLDSRQLNGPFELLEENLDNVIEESNKNQHNYSDIVNDFEYPPSDFESGNDNAKGNVNEMSPPSYQTGSLESLAQQRTPECNEELDSLQSPN